MMEEGKEWCGEHITYNGFKTIFEVWPIKFFNLNQTRILAGLLMGDDIETGRSTGSDY